MGCPHQMTQAQVLSMPLAIPRLWTQRDEVPDSLLLSPDCQQAGLHNTQYKS